MDKRVLPANIEMTATLSQQQAVVCGARSDDTSKSGSLLDIQRRKKAEQEERLSAFADWRLQTPVKADVADVTGIARAALTDREWEIVQHDAVSLLQGYSQGRYTVLEVTRAYCHAATVAHDLTNCLTEIFYDEGLARAEELDRHYRETGQMIGPLHGVPISIKDHILLRGHDTSSGYAGWAFDSRANRDAVMVAVLRQAGAILYLKTANPQTLLSLETNNNIYGRTVNPYNRNLTSGGSSGGESALIALHGSVMGVGTDIGGSIRVPAAHCGIYGLKGSNARLPHDGLNGSHKGMDAIVGSAGPMTRSARDLALFSKVMLDAEPWLIEPQILEIPWRQNLVEGPTGGRKLSVAILWDDGVVSPHPPILQALRDTERVLQAAGHDVIRWQPIDNHQAAWDLISTLYFPDGAQEYRDLMRDTGDTPVPQTEWILGFAPDHVLTLQETWKLNVDREAFRTQLAAHWLASKEKTKKRQPVDVVLTPVAPTLAPPHDTSRWWGYTSYWNLADYPGVVFPVGRHTQSTAYDTAREWPSKPPRNPVEKIIHGQWEPKVYENAPISLQLVARRLNEEKLLYALSLVEEAVARFRV